jgi:hypothetical protein
VDSQELKISNLVSSQQLLFVVVLQDGKINYEEGDLLRFWMILLSIKTIHRSEWDFFLKYYFLLPDASGFSQCVDLTILAFPR